MNKIERASLNQAISRSWKIQYNHKKISTHWLIILKFFLKNANTTLNENNNYVDEIDLETSYA